MAKISKNKSKHKVKHKEVKDLKGQELIPPLPAGIASEPSSTKSKAGEDDNG